MIRYTGKGVYGAIAVGKIAVFKRDRVQVKRDRIKHPDAELARLEDGKHAAIRQLEALHEKALKEVGEANAQIFEIHMMMVEDEDFNEAISEMIQGQRINAEYAVSPSDSFSASMPYPQTTYLVYRS